MIQALKSKYVLSIMLALAIGMILHYSINAFKKIKQSQSKYILELEFHSITRYRYEERADSLIKSVCIENVKIKMKFNADTLIFESEEMAKGFKPISLSPTDKSTILTHDEHGRSFIFRRVKSKSGAEAIWAPEDNTLNVLSTDSTCFEFE